MIRIKIVWPLIVSCFLYMEATGQIVNQKYDSTLAASFDADDYGMKGYVFVLLKTGGNTTSNKAFTDSCFAGHMKNIGRMVDAGKLVVAGPFKKNESLFRGIFILNVKTIEEAEALLRNDPAVSSDLLKAEMYHWYGSAALPSYLQSADKIWKVQP